jgi:hypothetical protein
MNFDMSGLDDLNVRIGDAESAGDYAFFDRHLAPAFAMSRSDGTIETRDTFLDNPKESASRSTKILSVCLLGANRAAVSCLAGLNGELYENHRMFARESQNSAWQFLSWANEIHGASSVRPLRYYSRMNTISRVYGTKSWTEWTGRRKNGGGRERYLGDTKHSYGSPEPVLEVGSYVELADIVAFLTVMYKNLTLLFRGQMSDFKFLPSMHRSSCPANATDDSKGNLDKRIEYWKGLQRKEQDVVPVLRQHGLPRHRHIEDPQIRYARWAVMQPSELWPTPTLASSLRVAASLAFGPVPMRKEGYLYVTGTRKLRSDLMPLHHDDAVERSDGVLSIRLNSVCPPSAVRPHLPDGALMSLYPFDDEAALDPTRNNFGTRVIAKFKLVDTGTFWTEDFPCHTKAALLPDADLLHRDWRISLGLQVDD